jgi:signal transduction histidine kinase
VLRRHRQLAHEVARTEELAAQSERELRVERDLHRLKTSFVSMVSHEFRTPLGIIMSSAEILESYFQRLDETRRREHLQDIVDAARRMNDLIGEVLLLGQVDAGRMECCVRAVDLAALCRKVIEDVGMATQQRCPVLFEAEIWRGSPQLDERLVTIILSNLLNNAVKYSSVGESVHLSTRRDGVDVTIELRDEGIGIPSEDQAELFKTFRRGRNVGDVPGTGLGLTIVKRCVDIHRGNISFISSEDAGTTFTVRLPGFLAED